MRSPRKHPVLIGGRFWLFPSGRLLPVIAGAEEPTPEEKAAAEKAEAEAAAAKAKADEEAAAAAKAELEKLGEGGKAALDAERKARKDAERDLKAAQKLLKDAEDAKLSETEKLRKDADEGKALAAKATDTLRLANLRLALASTKNIADPKAAAKLIDGVEYDDDHEPTNLDDRVKALLIEYPLLKGGKPAAPDIDGKNGNGNGPTPKLTAEELEAAKDFGMTPEEYQAFKDPNAQLPPAKKD
jgi:hypothetical protein